MLIGRRLRVERRLACLGSARNQEITEACAGGVRRCEKGIFGSDETFVTN